ncbi:MFS transporter [Pseudomonas sp. 5P_3.1_Bac2]|uniref:MFS transporter n=1 Tax=Pseudomonas sp. 5P_3.1_Bac2 TaxID=2971617 RepID=UPI0021C9EDE6|nr:MFS transporter [Pseudomonas sp. 5P_3.1_Bac2]MCU1716205.1 MFS transporter [Pseudomonas sp. 5P_3.1_Bac2]
MNTKLSSNTRLGLLTVLALVLLVAMDGSVLYLAMPSITCALHPSATQTLWILDSYGFVVGALLIAFGNIGDRYGRLKLIMFGALIFGLGSLGVALSSSAQSMILFRLLMGIGGATLLPSGLALVSALFPDPRQRAQAIGVFAATFASGFAIGPIIGGLLLEHFAWGVVFLINVPVVLLFLVTAPVLLRDVRSESTGPIDWLSVLGSLAAIVLLSYAIKTTALNGFNLPQLAATALGLAAMAGFLVRQTRLQFALIDLSLFKDPTFALAIATGLVSLLVWAAMGYLSGIYLQTVLGFSVVASAWITVPGALALIVTCLSCSRLVERIGRKRALIITHLLIGFGTLLLLTTDIHRGAAVLVASAVVAGIGYGLSFSLVAEVAISAVPAQRAGAAAAIAETSNELGNALGITLLGSLAAWSFKRNGPGLADSLGQTLAHPLSNAQTLLQAQQAYVSGLHLAAGVGALLALSLALLMWRCLPEQTPQ